MATEAGRIKINVNTNAGQATSELAGLDNALNKTGKSSAVSAAKLALVGGASLVLVGALSKAVGAIKNTIKAASDAQETNNKFAVTFGQIRDEADLMAENLAESYGLARQESEALLSGTGDLLTGFGFAQNEALELSSEVQKLAVDLASFTNIEGGTERASAALTSALFGEREAVKSLGIIITETDIKQRLAAKGMDKLTGQALLQAKANETLKIAYEQSKNAIGDFARSSTSYANQQRILNARLKDTAAEVGGILLPALQDLQSAFIEGGEGANVLIDALKFVAQTAALVVKAVAGIVRGLNAMFETAKGIAELNGELETTKETEEALLAVFGKAPKKMTEPIKEATNEVTKQNTQLKKAKSNAEEYQKQLKSVRESLAGAGDISASLALLDQKYQEQVDLAKRYGAETVLLDKFYRKQREEAMIEGFTTQADLESEDFEKRIEFYRKKGQSISWIKS